MTILVLFNSQENTLFEDTNNSILNFCAIWSLFPEQVTYVCPALGKGTEWRKITF